MLTEAQKRVAERLLIGEATATIAAALNVSEKTVKYHATAIYLHEGVKSKFELMAKKHKENSLLQRGSVTFEGYSVSLPDLTVNELKKAAFKLAMLKLGYKLGQEIWAPEISALRKILKLSGQGVINWADKYNKLEVKNRPKQTTELPTLPNRENRLPYTG